MATVSAIEARILGVLVEKQMTTPDSYPLTLAGVVAGSNQATNRDPVMSIHAEEAESALTRLHDVGLATPVRRQGDRATKFRHKLDDVLELDKQALAVLAVLLLRGAQTVGELRQRTDRYVAFDTIDDVERVIDRLEQSDLARRLARLPGQSQRRVRHLMSDGSVEPELVEAPEPIEHVEHEELRTRLTALEHRFDQLLQRLGVDDL
jgi:uncharacterized protein